MTMILVSRGSTLPPLSGKKGKDFLLGDEPRRIFFTFFFLEFSSFSGKISFLLNIPFKGKMFLPKKFFKRKICFLKKSLKYTIFKILQYLLKLCDCSRYLVLAPAIRNIRQYLPEFQPCQKTHFSG
jgi:hypothetical protein